MKIVFSFVVLSFTEKFFGGRFNVMISLFLRVQKFRDQYYVCCFTFEWRRMVRVVKQARDATTKGTTTRFEAKAFWLVLCLFCVV